MHSQFSWFEGAPKRCFSWNDVTAYSLSWSSILSSIPPLFTLSLYYKPVNHYFTTRLVPTAFSPVNVIKVKFGKL